MKIFNPFILLATIIVFFASCEDMFNTVVEVDLPEFDNQLVINSVITDTLPIAVNLYQTLKALETGINGSDRIVINNAKIDLYINDIWEETLYQLHDNGSYVGQTIPELGTKYTIEASANGYQTASASTIMPSNTNNIQAYISDTIANNLENEGGIEITVIFDDEDGIDNYYYLGLKAKILAYDYWLNDTTSFYEQLCFSSSDAVFSQQSKGLGIDFEQETPLYCNDKNLFTDNLFDGQTKILKVVLPFWYFANNDYYGSNINGNIIVEIGQYNTDLYLYQNSAIAQSISSNNPFAEPVSVYSNTSNGFGIFAAFNNQQIEVVD